MRKPTICSCENKGADQLRSNCEADQHLCFHYTDSTIPLLSKSEISSLLPSSVLVQPGLCRICSETTLLVFPRGDSKLVGTSVVFHNILRIVLIFIKHTEYGRTCSIVHYGVILSLPEIIWIYIWRSLHTRFTLAKLTN